MSYVDISTAMVRETRTVSATCTSVVVHEPPQRVFFLELVEPEIGGRAIVWDGHSYVDALDAASDWAADEVEVRDRIAATWGRP